MSMLATYSRLWCVQQILAAGVFQSVYDMARHVFVAGQPFNEGAPILTAVSESLKMVPAHAQCVYLLMLLALLVRPSAGLLLAAHTVQVGRWIGHPPRVYCS